ncbi:MAG: hypothetical protein IKX59_10290 [Bacteroidales bacterium]|nr:hypothetical protein [Bacteroidales bacterium]
MKHIVESVEEMYHAKEPFGEIVIDEVINVLRHFKVILIQDVALLLDVDPRELRTAWHLLTGTHLNEVVTQWRVMQAQDWIRKRLSEKGTVSLGAKAYKKLLTETAHRCGWRTERVMSHVFERYCGCSAIEWLAREAEALSRAR